MSQKSGSEIIETNSTSQYSSQEDNVKIKRIFINNVDSYHGKALCKIMHSSLPTPSAPSSASSSSSSKVTIHYEITGTIQNKSMNFDSEKYVDKLIERNDPSYTKLVTDCEFIIYDIGCKDKLILKEVQDILKFFENTFKNLKGNDQSQETLLKYFILISTPLTWVQTKQVKDNSNEIILEENYRKRRAHPMYTEHQYIERIAINIQKQCKPYVKTIVICPGITYGHENDVFHYIFKNAYFNEEIKIFHPGNQYIPIIYINDFVQMIKKIIEDFPKSSYRYIFAVQPNFITAKQFARAVTNNIIGNPYKVKIVPREYVMTTDPTLISEYVYDCLTLNLKMMPTYFKNYDFELKFDEFNNDIAKLLVKEYRIAKNLSPIKIIIDGPPFSGRTCLAKNLIDYYKINYVNPENIFNETLQILENDILEAKQFLEDLENEKPVKTDDDNDDDDEQQLDKIDEDIEQLILITSEKINVWEKEMNEIKEFLLNSDTTSLKSSSEETFDDFSMKKMCLFKILLSKSFNENHGYVMDGCPFVYQQLEQLFGKIKFTISEDEEEEEENNEDDNQENEEQKQIQNNEDEDEFIPKPEHVIILEAPDNLITTRAMQLTDAEAIATHNTEEEFMNKLISYHERNQDDTSISIYFLDNDIIPTTISMTDETTKEFIFEKVIEIIGIPHIYPLTIFEKETIAKTKEQENLLKQEKEKKVIEEILQKEREKREENLQEWTEKYERLKSEEQEILEAKSLPLQQYLSKFVLPTLTEGLLKVAEEKPNDPFDFLAEYLFQYNPNGHVLDPSYDDEKKTRLLSFTNEEMESIFKAESSSKDESVTENNDYEDEQIVLTMSPEIKNQRRQKIRHREVLQKSSSSSEENAVQQKHK